MLQFSFRPIESWPWNKTPRNRQRSKRTFTAPWSGTLDLLERELRYLRAREIVIQARVGLNEIRNDGMLYANARPAGPEIILSFESKHGPLSYHCDTCQEWQHNVRSIALTLKALRDRDRYGATSTGEQYKGWSRLPDKRINSSAELSDAKSAFDFLSSISKDPVESLMDNPPFCMNQMRVAMSKFHPDASGTDGTVFRKLVVAKKLIDDFYQGKV